MDNFNKTQEVGKQRNWNFHCRLLIFATYVNDMDILLFQKVFLTFSTLPKVCKN